MTEGSDPFGTPWVKVYDAANEPFNPPVAGTPMNSSDAGNHSDKAGEKVQHVLTELAAIAGAEPSTPPTPKPTNQALWDRLLGM